MRVHLLCDQKWRDLPNLSAIKLVLEGLGHRVLLSTTRDAAAMMSAFRPDCVVFNHLFAPSNQALATTLRGNNVAVVILPTEGAVRPELRPIAAGEFAKEWTMDLHLAWSAPAALAIQTRWNLSTGAVPVLGCTRFDFYSLSFRSAITPRDVFCRNLGLDPARPVVTWATAYGYAEVEGDPAAHAKFLRETAENGLAACYQRIGVDPVRVPGFHTEGRLASSAAFATLAKARPEIQFIIRPHPAEAREFYRSLIRDHGLGNVRFCPQDYIWNVLNATDLHLHRQCTTAVEAWMWDKPTVEMAMDRAPELTWPEHEAGSEIANDADALISIVDRFVSGKAKVGAEQLTYRRAYLAKWYGPTDGARCRAAAQAIDGLLAQRGRTRGPGSFLKGIPVSGSQVAKAATRYYMGLRPNESLLRRVPVADFDPTDKQITRHDVKRYETLIAGQAH